MGPLGRNCVSRPGMHSTAWLPTRSKMPRLLLTLAAIGVLLASAFVPISWARASGTTYTISGTVLGTDGPLANIYVVAKTESMNVDVVTTDAAGHYSMTVPPDSYEVWFNNWGGISNPDYAGGCYSSGIAGHVVMVDACTALVVGSSDVLGIDVALPALVHIHGTVLGLSGPVAGITVETSGTPVGQPELDNPDWIPAWDATTDEAGVFSLGVPSGGFIGGLTIEFHDWRNAPDGITYSDGCYEEGAAGNLSADDCTALNVGASDMTLDTVTMTVESISPTAAPTPTTEPTPTAEPTPTTQPTSTTEPTPTAAPTPAAAPTGAATVTLTGETRDSSGAPVDACVELESETESDQASDCSATSDWYSITVPPGQYTLSVVQYIPIPDVPGIYMSTERASLDVSESRSLDLVIPAWFTETVQVTDQTGAPVSGAVLTFTSGENLCSGAWNDTPGVSGTVDSGWWTPGLTTDASGAILVPYTSCPTPVGLQIAPPEGVQVSPIQTSIPPLTTQGVLPVTMPRPLISGTVTGPGGQPLEGIQVSTDWGAGATTDASGGYAITDLPEGTTGVDFSDPTGTYLQGCYSQDSEGGLDTTFNDCTAVDATQTAPVDVSMTALASHISGTVLGPDGPAVVQISVLSSGNLYGAWSTDAAGRYDLSLPPGTYTLVFIQSGDSPSLCYNSGTPGGLSPYGCTPVDAPAPGSTTTLPTVSMPSWSNVSGDVVGADGVSQPDEVQVCLYSPAWSIWQEKGPVCGPYSGYTSDQSGAFSFLALPGTFTLLFEDMNTLQVGCYAEGPAGPGFTEDLNACTPFTVDGDVSGVDVAIPGPGQTPTSADGNPVVTTPVCDGYCAHSTVTFGDVTVAGTTSIDQEQTGPDPGHFVLGSNPTYYEISTTAAFSGPATVCLSYDPSAYDDPGRVRLYHYDEAQGAWVDVTTTSGSDLLTGPFVCGQTSSFSPFVIGQSLQPTQSPQSIAFAGPGSQTYGTGPITLTATASSGLPVSYSTAGPCSVDGTTLSIVGAGTCTITASQPGNDDWQAAAPVGRSITISKAILTVAADSQFKTYGSTNPGLTYSVSGFVAGDTIAALSGAPSLSTTAVAGSPVGAYPITVEAGTLAAANYSFTFVPGTLEVDKAALTITAPNLSRSYGAPNPTLTPAYVGLVAGDTPASLPVQPTCATTATIYSPVGTYPVACAGAVDPNYAVVYLDGSLTIAIADRFVTAANTTLSVAAPGFLALTSAPGATVVISTKPAGALTLGSAGAFTYAPKSGFKGTDSFAYRLNVNGSLSAPVTVTIYVVGTGMSCVRCDLSGLTLSGASLTGANLSSADLAGSQLTSASLTGANLSGADLSYARLDRANLTGANLSAGVLSGATITYANLTGANLSKAALVDADLSGATLTGANLSGANLTGATLAGATLTGVGWSNATCPDGTSARAGGTCVGHLGH